MFNRILIANRGEIALRIIRACRELDIETVAVYSEADKDSMHVKLADKAYCIGPAQSTKSYLHIPNIISVACISQADAIHPGYGFLAENAYFAELCETNGFTFIGPSAKLIAQMGDKAAARAAVIAADAPVVPGTKGIVANYEQAKQVVAEIGYPVIIKASAGGGGKGMRVAQNAGELQKMLQTAQTEAKAAFANGDVYIEKYLEEPRHVEFQILADNYGNVLHLGERDCSIQRRHQKVIEESPCSALTPEKRAEMGAVAIKIAKAVNYTSAGTIEFLLDKSGAFYFMEMNTRIQVEHPVSEMITNVDLVKEQIKIAAGEKIDFTQADVRIEGHAIECRINAEDPDNNFMPFPGKVTTYQIPGGPGIRVDSCVYPGYTITPYYDSMVAKLVAYGKDRAEAIARMKRALDEFHIEGVRTTLPFHKKVIANAFYQRGEVYTNFIQRRILGEK